MTFKGIEEERKSPRDKSGLVALSLTQPWAWLVVQTGEEWKDIENRVWNTSFRGEFYVHASKGLPLNAYDGCIEWVRERFGEGMASRIPSRSTLYRGGIIGKARLTSVIEPWSLEPLRERASWHMQDQFGFVLKDRKALPFVPCKGMLGFWEVPPEVLAQVEAR